jgi:translation initiation factor eIF-2B subunit epsilon
MTPLQLSDAAPQSFRPLTVERPKVLLPLVGVPLIEYTLEWLVSSGITEVHSPLRDVTACA